MSETVDFALAVRDVVAAGWTQEALARDASGKSVSWDDETAVAWCVMGAAVRVQLIGGDWFARDPWLCALEERVGEVVAWNNAPERTQQEIVETLDEVARVLKEQEL